MLKPLLPARWNFETAAHLLNRAGFGAAPASIERLADAGLEKAVTELVDYENTADPTLDPVWAKPDPSRAERFRMARQAGPEERRKLQQEEQREQRRRMIELRAWWLQRMAAGYRPLQEKMVLFWHGHFATSVEKVRNAYLMWRQNELFRRLATGSWQRLLVEAGKDPAMLIWLDQAQSRKQHPNENFAREVMELFALGEGHYTEKDVTEGARALTGWSFDRASEKFVERPNWHDEGEKVIFGERGNFNGGDFLGLVVAQPQAARFICAKLWNYFAGQPPSDELVTELAEIFRRSGDQFKPVLRAIFSSEEFYSQRIVRNQVKSPVQWLVGSVRVLERPLPPPLACFALTRNLGQDLFAPPNVKGWDGGLSWITTNNLLARYNEAATLVQGDASVLAGAMFTPRPDSAAGGRPFRGLLLQGVEADKLFTEAERQSPEALATTLQKRLLQGRLSPKHEEALRQFLSSDGPPNDERILAAIRLVMSTPEFQLT